MTRLRYLEVGYSIYGQRSEEADTLDKETTLYPLKGYHFKGLIHLIKPDLLEKDALQSLHLIFLLFNNRVVK